MKAKFVSENMKFERGREPKESLGLGPHGRLREILEKNNNNDASEEIGLWFLEIIGSNWPETEPVGLSSLGLKAFGIDSNKGEFDFSWFNNGDIQWGFIMEKNQKFDEMIGPRILGNLIKSPEDIDWNFRSVFNMVDIASDIRR